MMWKGLSGMDAARAAMGQGWPFAAGPWNIIGAREPRRSRGRMQGQAFLVTFSAFGKSDSPSRAKPMPQPTRANRYGHMDQSPKSFAAKAAPTTAHYAGTRRQHHPFDLTTSSGSACTSTSARGYLACIAAST